jgi:hypothetical protein
MGGKESPESTNALNSVIKLEIHDILDQNKHISDQALKYCKWNDAKPMN